MHWNGEEKEEFWAQGLDSQNGLQGYETTQINTLEGEMTPGNRSRYSPYHSFCWIENGSPLCLFSREAWPHGSPQLCIA